MTKGAMTAMSSCVIDEHADPVGCRDKFLVMLLGLLTDALQPRTACATLDRGNVWLESSATGGALIKFHKSLENLY